jgi:hypothetical protein
VGPRACLEGCGPHNTFIIIIIIVILVIPFVQGIYNNVLGTNHVSRVYGVYIVAGIL